MSPSLLLCCLLLGSVCWMFVQSHILMEEQQSSLSLRLHSQTHAPPLVIVGLSNTSKKNKKFEKKPKKKFPGKVKRPVPPPPPPNCVPLWASCGPGNACCDPCAFCHCRLFKTVCYCRMGYPKC